MSLDPSALLPLFRKQCALAAILAGVIGGPPAPGQVGNGPAQPVERAPRSETPKKSRPQPTLAQVVEAAKLERQSNAAFLSGDFAAAEELLHKQLELTPDSFVVLYNLACARSMQRDAAGAAEWLKRSIERGFVDIYHLRRDPHMVPARRGPAVKQLEETWPAVLDAQRDSNLRRAKEYFVQPRERYTTVTDARFRVVYLSAVDGTSFEQARKDLDRLSQWGLATVFTDLAEPQPTPLDAWVVVVLPTPGDFRQWAVSQFGPGAVTGNSGIGGSYIHDDKRLVAQDLGATLRHEFFHALHWRSATRLGQDHPVWIQEGLCSLVEDYEAAADGSLRPVPSWRTNIARRLLKGNTLLSLQKLAVMPRERFVGDKPLATYAQARTFFLYLWSRGKLGEWYKAYTAGYNEDPTGVKAVESVLHADAAEIDRDYRVWLRALPEVAEQIRPGSAGLGVEVDAGPGDGPAIVEVPRGSAAQLAGLRAGDVITAIDGQPTRDLNELVRLLGEKQIGDEIEVAYRRGKVHGTARVRLEAR